MDTVITTTWSPSGQLPAYAQYTMTVSSIWTDSAGHTRHRQDDIAFPDILYELPWETRRELMNTAALALVRSRIQAQIGREDAP
jgi:hypothetical protein